MIGYVLFAIVFIFVILIVNRKINKPETEDENIPVWKGWHDD